LLEARFGAGFRFRAQFFKVHGAAVLHGYPVWMGNFDVATVGFECPEDADGHDCGGGFDDG